MDRTTNTIPKDEEISQAEYEKQQLWLQDFVGENSKYVKILRTEYNQLRDQRKGEAVGYMDAVYGAIISKNHRAYLEEYFPKHDLSKMIPVFTHAQPNALVEALEELLLSVDAWAKAKLSCEVAEDNFTDSSAELKVLAKAAERCADAEKQAKAILATHQSNKG